MRLGAQELALVLQALYPHSYVAYFPTNLPLFAVSHFAITAIGRDRPGIVAAVTETLYRLKCNIEDSQMSILKGHFAMVLVISAPKGLDEANIEAELASARDQLQLEAVVARPVAEIDAGRPQADHVLTVYGADHPGIVAAVSGRLAELEVNIIDLNTRLAGDPGNPLYAMMMELVLPAGLSEEELRESLDIVGKDAGVEVSLRPLESDAL